MPPSDREEVKEVTVAAGVKRTAPVETDISFPPGQVVAVDVVIPPGPAGLGGFQLTNSGQQAMPYNAGAFFIGDNETIHREVVGYNNSGRWGFRGFNEDVNPHTFQIRFSVVENDVIVAPAQSSGPINITGTGEVPTSPGSGPVEQPAPGEGETPIGKVPGTGPIGEPPSGKEPPALGEEEPPKEGELEFTEEGPEPPPPSPTGPPGEGEAPEPGEPPLTAAEEEEEEGEPKGSDLPTIVSETSQPTTGSGKRRSAPGVKKVVKTVTLHAGGWLPAGARFTHERVDQGQDLITNWRGPIVAPGNGYVVHNLSDKPFPVGFGPHYAVVHIETGPFAGADWYIGHCTSVVNTGERFVTGRVLAHADQGQREGGGWAEIGIAPGGYPGPMGSGAKYAHLFGDVGRKVVVQSAPKPTSHKPPAKRKPAGKPSPRHKPPHRATVPRGGKPAPKRAPAKGPSKGHTAPPHGHPLASGHGPAPAPPKRASGSSYRAPRPAPKPPPAARAKPSPPRRTPAKPSPPVHRPAPAPPRPAPHPVAPPAPHPAPAPKRHR